MGSLVRVLLSACDTATRLVFTYPFFLPDSSAAPEPSGVGYGQTLSIFNPKGPGFATVQNTTSCVVSRLRLRKSNVMVVPHVFTIITQFVSRLDAIPSIISISNQARDA